MLNGKETARPCCIHHRWQIALHGGVRGPVYSPTLYSVGFIHIDGGGLIIIDIDNIDNIDDIDDIDNIDNNFNN